MFCLLIPVSITTQFAGPGTQFDFPSNMETWYLAAAPETAFVTLNSSLVAVCAMRF